MQPTWRTRVKGTLKRDAPAHEDWLALKKGGTAGIYVVVMGLSWWIMAQTTARKADAWSAVADLSWTIRQMKEIDLLATDHPKRGRNEDEEEHRPRKRCAIV